MDWQQITVYLVVAGAALYLAWGWWRGRKAGACGGCHNSCEKPPASEAGGGELVQLELRPRTDMANGRSEPHTH